MRSIYETTSQGKQTRSRLLHHLGSGEELSREDLVQRSGLTYEQVRRQTRNLVMEGILVSRLEAGKRVYSLAASITPLVSSFILALLLG